VTLDQLILDLPHRAAHGAEDSCPVDRAGGIARTPSALLQRLEVAEQRRHIFRHRRVDMRISKPLVSRTFEPLSDEQPIGVPGHRD
jgi:hypothetical protein